MLQEAQKRGEEEKKEEKGKIRSSSNKNIYSIYIWTERDRVASSNQLCNSTILLCKMRSLFSLLSQLKPLLLHALYTHSEMCLVARR